MVKSLPRLVLDTNVIVSAVISVEGVPSKLLRACLEGQAILLVSDPIIREYFEVLKYPKIQKYNKLDAAYSGTFLVFSDPH